MCELFWRRRKEEDRIVIRVLVLFVWLWMWIFLENLGKFVDGFNVLGVDGRLVLIVKLFVDCSGKVCKNGNWLG